MQSSGLDPIFYKKIEDDINRKLFAKTNSYSFIRTMGEVLEEHLNQLVALRKLSERMLDCMGLPTRDDIAEIAKKVIENEDRLDCLDEILYMALRNVEEYKNQIAKLAWEMAQVSAEFSVEMAVALVKI